MIQLLIGVEDDVRLDLGFGLDPLALDPFTEEEERRHQEELDYPRNFGEFGILQGKYCS